MIKKLLVMSCLLVSLKNLQASEKYEYCTPEFIMKLHNESAYFSRELTRAHEERCALFKESNKQPSHQIVNASTRKCMALARVRDYAEILATEADKVRKLKENNCKIDLHNEVYLELAMFEYNAAQQAWQIRR